MLRNPLRDVLTPASTLVGGEERAGDRSRSRNLFLLALFILSAPAGVYADLRVITARESDLPFALSPRNFVNSTQNLNNQASNLTNSAQTLLNSASIVDNSPSNPANGRNGNRRLLWEQNGSNLYIGYYVQLASGMINFFSARGDRFFYSPPGTAAVFGSESGSFCGVVATQQGETVLVLTESGQSVLAGAGVSLFGGRGGGQTPPRAGLYGDGGLNHFVVDNVSNGQMLVLEDKSIWAIEERDRYRVGLWLPMSKIAVIHSMGGPPGYDYTLVNLSDQEVARARYLGNTK